MGMGQTLVYCRDNKAKRAIISLPLCRTLRTICIMWQLHSLLRLRISRQNAGVIDQRAKQKRRRQPHAADTSDLVMAVSRYSRICCDTDCSSCKRCNWNSTRSVLQKPCRPLYLHTSADARTAKTPSKHCCTKVITVEVAGVKMVITSVDSGMVRTGIDMNTTRNRAGSSQTKLCAVREREPVARRAH